jgi:hypothetical protein
MKVEYEQDNGDTYIELEVSKGERGGSDREDQVYVSLEYEDDYGNEVMTEFYMESAVFNHFVDKLVKAKEQL